MIFSACAESGRNPSAGVALTGLLCAGLLWSHELMRGTTVPHPRVTADASPPRTLPNRPGLFTVWESRVKSRPPSPTQWPRRCLSHCLSHWSGFCLVTFFFFLPPPHSISSSIHSIRSFLFLSVMVILTSIRGTSFSLPVPRGGLSPPRGVLFVCSSVEAAELSSRWG